MKAWVGFAGEPCDPSAPLCDDRVVMRAYDTNRTEISNSTVIIAKQAVNTPIEVKSENDGIKYVDIDFIKNNALTFGLTVDDIELEANSSGWIEKRQDISTVCSSTEGTSVSMDLLGKIGSLPPDHLIKDNHFRILGKINPTEFFFKLLSERTAISTCRGRHEYRSCNLCLCRLLSRN
jgi:hypothetical protein